MADTKISVELMKEVREITGAQIMRVKQVLEEQNGDRDAAIDILKKEKNAKMEKRADRETGAGIIKSYVHHNQKVAVIVELLAETDFVTSNELFQTFGDSVALQIASMKPENVEELLKQDFIKDPSKTIEDLLKEVTAKTGENAKIGRFSRLEVGE